MRVTIMRGLRCPCCGNPPLLHREGCPVLASTRAWAAVRAAAGAWARWSRSPTWSLTWPWGRRRVVVRSVTFSRPAPG